MVSVRCNLISMDASNNRKEVPVELARAGEARHFIAWRAAVAGLGGGHLSDFATAAEAVITDIYLSGVEGTLVIESEHTSEELKIYLAHPEMKKRRMADLEEMLDKFLDGYEISPTREVLIKRL